MSIDPTVVFFVTIITAVVVMGWYVGREGNPRKTRPVIRH
jgi:hypothetical protein